MRSALVIGGTGPTGHFIVNGLRARGHRVATLHSGRHEVPEIPDDVEHIHTDPFYYVEYGLAQLGSFQVWRNALQDQAGAVAAYRSNGISNIGGAG